MKTRVVQVERSSLSPGAPRGGRRWLTSAVRALRAGKLVAFPTETVYGVGAIASLGKAFDRLAKLKDRANSPFTVHIGDPEDALRYVQAAPVRARTLMSKAWPGPLTILLHTGGRLADRKLGGKAVHRRLAPKGVIGLRCPTDPVARELLRRVGKPVVASSANLTGGKPPASAAEVLKALDGRIDLLLDAGPAEHGKASTIVAFDGEEYEILRPGAYGARDIARMMRRMIVFVCTGNTCRSPMAEGLAKELLADKLGCKAAELASLGMEVISAGVVTSGGSDAADNAVAAAAKRGADIANHRSRRLTNSLINAADLVFCMTRSHAATVIRTAPDAAGKTYLLDDAGDIGDPIGGDARVYDKVAEGIEGCLRRRMEENLL